MKTDFSILDELLSSASSSGPTSTARAAAWIYGAGSKGRGLARLLAHNHIEVKGIVDRNAERLRGDWCEDVPLHSLETAQALLIGKHKPDLYLGIHNFATDLQPVYVWAGHRFGRVYSVVDILDMFPDWAGPHYWASPRAFTLAHGDALRRMWSRIADDLGRKAYLAHVAFRLSGQPEHQIEPTFEDQYAPRSLPALNGAQTVIDCGAFNGDSLEKIARREALASIIAFEPDAAQLAALQRVCERLTPGAFTIACSGVWDRQCTLKFEPIGPGSGTFTEVLEDGAPNAVSIDHFLAAHPHTPSLIKMDIEGAELKALEGARESLLKYRPALALSAYHKPEDLWLLADWLEQLDIGYQFTFRSHGRNNFDLVLYARGGFDNAQELA